MLKTILFLSLCLNFIDYSYSDKVNVSPTFINNLDKSQSYSIDFQLDSIIECQDPHVLCNVVILFTNPAPNEISIEPCMLEWSRDEWYETKSVTITAIENFIDDGGQTYTLVTEPIISNAVYYSGVDIDDITVQTRSHSSGHCSSTGDPHYTTFDGHYYHFYGRGIVLMVRSLIRDFEVQAITHGGGYSRNCAIAVKDNNDLVIMDACDGSFEITSRITSDNAPNIYTRGGNNYFVDFASGARVQVNTWGSNMNVYIDVPGIDWKNTVGMCGTFDGDRNNEGNPSYVISSYSSLPSLWKIDDAESLWNWTPSEENESTDGSEDNGLSRTCQYRRPLIIRPILQSGNIEDITELIKNVRNRAEDDLLERNYTFIPSDEEIPQTISEERAQELCSNRILGSSVGIMCSDTHGIDLVRYYSNCVEDLLIMGDEAFIDDSYDDMIRMCEAFIINNVSNWDIVTDSGSTEYIPPLDIVRNLCPDGCSRFGQCIDGECVCQENYGGSSCDIDLLRSPTVNDIYPYKCDINNPDECGSFVRINGDNFLKSDRLTCIYNTYLGNYSKEWYSSGVYLGHSTILCPIPLNKTRVFISVSNTDNTTIKSRGESYTDFINRMESNVYLTWYNSICVDCYENGTCIFLDEHCHSYEQNIDFSDNVPLWMRARCIERGVRNEENSCQMCNPEINISGWVYDTESVICSPHFTNREYILYFNENTDIEQRISLSIHNNLVPINQYNVSYDIGEHNVTTHLDKKTGELVISGVFNYEREMEYNIPLWLKDGEGNIIDTSLLKIMIYDIDEEPYFSQDNYSYKVTYNLNEHAFSYDELSVLAIDPDFGSEFNHITYSISDRSELFTINSETGVIGFNEEEMNVVLRHYVDNTLQQNKLFQIEVSVLDGNQHFISTIVNIEFVSTNYEWVTNTSIEPMTYAPTEPITQSENIIPWYNEHLTNEPLTEVPLTEDNNELLENETLEDEFYVSELLDNVYSETSQEENIGGTTGIIIMAIVISIIVVLGIVIIYKNRISENQKINDEYINSNRNMIENPVYSRTVFHSPNTGYCFHDEKKGYCFHDEKKGYCFHDEKIGYCSQKKQLGRCSHDDKELAKPDWFYRSLTDYQYKDILQNKGQGAFIVTNVPNKPYELFFVIKHNNRLERRDILFDIRNGYYLYGVLNAKCFQTLNELVEYYMVPQVEFQYKLISGEPLYDNCHLSNTLSCYQRNTLNSSQRNTLNSVIRYITNGPPLPKKISKN